MIHFVGAGSGAPDLITVRGKNLIQQADVIIYAGSLVNPALLADKKPECQVYNSAYMHLDEIIERMRTAAEQGLETVRLHTGDGSIFGAIKEQMEALDKLSIAYDICPGVSSFLGAAASLQIQYTAPEISQTVILTRMAGRTGVPEKETIQSLAAHQATMVIFLSAGFLKELSEALQMGGYPADTPAAIIYKATWPDEKICHCTAATLEKAGQAAGITKTALIIVGDVLGALKTPSKLYDAAFSTEFREGRP